MTDPGPSPHLPPDQPSYPPPSAQQHPQQHPQPYGQPSPPPYGQPYPQPFRPVLDLTVPGVLTVTVAGATALTNLAAAALVGRATDARTAAGVDVVTGVWGLLTLLGAAGLLAGWLTGGFWLHRARANAEILFPQSRHVRSSGWAWGAWVCPVVSLWFPFQVVRDVRLAPQPSRYLGSALVTWWWTAWLVSQIGDYVIGRAAGWAIDHPGHHPALQAFSLIWAALFVAAAVLWAVVVLRITRDQQSAASGAVG